MTARNRCEPMSPIVARCRVEFLQVNRDLASAQPECLPHRGDSRGVGEGKAESHFVSTGLDVTPC